MTKTGLIAAAALAALLGACNQGPATPEKTVQQLMAQDVQPTAEIYWNAVQFISDETGDHDIKPETDADWAKTKAAAVKLQELAALLRTPGYTEGRGEDWTTFANSLTDVAKLAEQAADAKDPDKIFEVGGTMYNVCSACHQVYPATTGPEAEEQAKG
jgi:cytochrome c556